ncbi:MAG TPA: lactonase family protein [Balneolales bacterium]|nr:lactonase family protein [Balneolales bacterium]
MMKQLSIQRNRLVSLVSFLVFCFLIAGCNKKITRKPEKDFIYIGTFSNRGSKGIYVFRFDRKTGKLRFVQATTHEKSPSFVTITPNKKYLYAGCRGGIPPNKKWGSVVAYRINQKSGKLSYLNVRPAYGPGSCFVDTSPNGKMVFVANYVGGDLAAYKIDKNGMLSQVMDTIVHQGHGVNPARQAHPHVHSTVPSPNGKYVYASDLGTDKIYTYIVDYQNGSLTPGKPPFIKTKPGDGPRHLVFTNSSKYAYSVHEMGSSVTAYRYDAQNGSLHFIKRYSTLPKDYQGKNKAAEIHLGPKDKFLYVSNRGDNSLAIFKINKNDGKLTRIDIQKTHGDFPRNFIVDPLGNYVIVANRHSDNLVVFKRNQKTGLLTYTGEQVKVPVPVCVKWIRLS